MESDKNSVKRAGQAADSDVNPCCGDPYAALPPDLRPAQAQKNTGLRKVTCPECGQEYWTNSNVDLCIHCSSGQA
jgi:hypothetical protein